MTNFYFKTVNNLENHNYFNLQHTAELKLIGQRNTKNRRKPIPLPPRQMRAINRDPLANKSAKKVGKMTLD